MIIFLDNNFANIWAFDENIDNKTENEINNSNTITNINDIIKYLNVYLLKSKDDIDNIFIDNIFNNILNFDENYNITLQLNNAKINKTQYILCGWSSYTIVICYEKQWRTI